LCRRKIQATSRQIVVGQAGFMLTQISVLGGGHSPRSFALAFDCGTVNREHMVEARQRWQSRNFIFSLSHTWTQCHK